MKYHITHISLAFTLGMSFTALPRSATSCHHWLGCLICPRIPREISWSLFIRGSIWQTGVFSSYFSFFNNLVDIQKQLQEKQRGDELVSRRNKSPFLLFWPMLQRRLQLHHSQDVLWCLAAQYIASFAPPSGLTWKIMAQTSWRGVHRFWYCRAQPAQEGQVLVCCSTALCQESPQRATSYSPCHGLVRKR